MHVQGMPRRAVQLRLSRYPGGVRLHLRPQLRVPEALFMHCRVNRGQRCGHGGDRVNESQFFVATTNGRREGPLGAMIRRA